MHNAHSSVVVEGAYTSRMSRQASSQAHFEPQLVVDQQFAEFSGRDVECNDPTLTRKMHKADRERLRRDHFNEQFAKLAGVLDAVRPKNDKGAILADSISVVNELRLEIERLKSEKVTLTAESQDLSQEKREFWEEKTALETETKRLENQLSENLSTYNTTTVPEMDLSMLNASQFAHLLPVKSFLSVQESPEKPITNGNGLEHISDPSSFVAPRIRAHDIYSSGQIGSRYMPYPQISQFGHHIPVERPYARYASPIHPISVLVQEYAQTLSTDSQTVVTDLQLQMPGVATSPTEGRRNLWRGNSLRRTDGAQTNGVAQIGAVTSKYPAASSEELSIQLSLSTTSIPM